MRELASVEVASGNSAKGEDRRDAAHGIGTAAGDQVAVGVDIPAVIVERGRHMTVDISPA
jgi:hypothetical protein